MTKKTGEGQIELLDIDELAAMLKTTAKALRSARSRGHLPAAARIPGVGVRWRRSDVEAWLERRFAAASAAP